MEKDILIEKLIIPRMLVYKQQPYIIEYVNPSLLITKYNIKLDSANKLEEVRLYQEHPNSQPGTNLFCLPKNLIKSKLTADLKTMIEFVISIYNLDSCYFMPWDKIKYKNIEV